MKDPDIADTPDDGAVPEEGQPAGVENVEPEAASEPPGAPASEQRAQRRRRAACDALRALLRDHYVAHFGAEPRNEGRFSLSLSLNVDPADGWTVRFDPPFTEQIGEQIGNAEAEWEVFHRGHVFCFRCRSAQCPHSVPPEPQCVFKGYNSVGLPRWHDLVQAFVDARDPRTDRLYAEPPTLLARVQLGRELRNEQLSSFGRASRTYAVLGQVIAGYVSVPRKLREATGQVGRFALTLQVVETRGARGQPELRVNPLPAGLTPEQWDEFLVMDANPLARPVLRAERAVEALERELQAVRDAVRAAEARGRLRRLPRILGDLARQIEQGGRRKHRRTRHAEDRRRERPVHKAQDDARAASEDDVFFDEKRQTLVVCGRQGRAHAFTRRGRHVTSFVLPPGGADFRVRTARWRKARTEEFTELKAALSRHTGEATEESSGARPA
jgi:hypothetical protein